MLIVMAGHSYNQVGHSADVRITDELAFLIDNMTKHRNKLDFCIYLFLIVQEPGMLVRSFLSVTLPWGYDDTQPTKYAGKA